MQASTAASLAVVDLDVGKRDIQQCMDSIMRLRGEYWWSRGKPWKTSFRYSHGRYFSFRKWSQGLRPKVVKRRLTFVPKGRAGSSRSNYNRFLRYMFAMTGTINQTREPKISFSSLQAGDFFLQPARSATVYGHAVVLLDLARNAKGQLVAMIGEGYMPAQDFHVLRHRGTSPWYPLSAGKAVKTPQWPAFTWAQLHRFRY